MSKSAAANGRIDDTDWPRQGPLVDRFGRTVRKLRISVTDRCNFRCVYCMPEDVEFMPAGELLTFEEIERVVRILAPLGVHKLRLTGGEPLLRPDVPDLVARLAAVPGITSVGMTTNGFFLARQARALKEAGLSSINISLDTMDRQRFIQIARRDFLDEVLDGIRAADEAGFAPIKINCVAMRGVNDHEIETFLHWARERPYIVRFIEFMPLDGDNIWERRLVFTAEEILEIARGIGEVISENNDPADPARRYRFADGRGTFGIIASVTQPFCAHCDRIRLTADGKIRNCLFALEEHDLRDLLRGGASDAEIEQAVRRAVWVKWAGHLINMPEFVKPSRTMHAIGG
ncbi:MAG TPA: GTP 3',8-cyclase MoaA [Bacillota bacterium]